ncbi:response regulator [Streptomyces ossamyceticus]|uniref:response regulator n=1 Tax=Streptomyces ossamyceticus TaxID=249581 RepID=UPI0006E298AC
MQAPPQVQDAGVPGVAAAQGAVPVADAAQAPGVGQAVVAGQVPRAPAGGADDGRHDAALHNPADDHTPPQPHPLPTPTGRRRAVRPAAQQGGAGAQVAAGQQPGPAQVPPGQGVPPQMVPGQPVPAQGATAPHPVPAQGVPAPQPVPAQGAPMAAAPAQAAAAGQPIPAQGLPGAPQPVPAQGVPGAAAQATAAQATAAQATAAQAAAVPPQGVAGPAQQVPAQAAAPGPPMGATAPAPGQPVGAPGAGAQPVPGQGVPGAAAQAAAVPAQGTPQQVAAPGRPGPVHGAVPGVQGAPQPVPAQGVPGAGQPAHATPQAQPQSWPDPGQDSSGAGVPVAGAQAPLPPQSTPSSGTPLPPERAVQQPRAAQPLPAEAAPTAGPVASLDPNSTQGRAISVRTLGQGVPFARQGAPQAQGQPQPGSTPAPNQPGGSGRRRKLGTPPEPAGDRPESAARPHPQPGQAKGNGGGQTPLPAQPGQPSLAGQVPLPPHASLAGQVPLPPQPSLAGQSRLVGNTDGAGRSYAIGAPDKNADEGPEPLDGPGGAVEVPDRPQPQPMDDELPPEPLDNPRRLLVWPAPDVPTHQALSERGYRPVIVNSREDVNAQIAAYPAALFVDPLTGPITRTALQSLRQAAVAAEVPVLVTAGLGQATRDAAYGADPAILLKALAPRDSEQHPPRVLLIEEHAEIALALTATLERRGMQVARAASDTDAVTLAAQMRPNLVVMDLLQVHRHQAGIIDWLRTNGQLNRTPLVVYTAAVDQAELPRLASGETVLFLAERSTSPDVQTRIVDLLARIGTN